MDQIRTLSSREAFANRWLRLREDQIEYADGTRGVYTVVEKKDFALVVPWTGDGYWLVEQFRYALGRREWEFPQGAWPDGSSGTAEELAAAELGEETGLTAGSLTHLGRLNSAAGYAANTFDVYLATELIEGEPRREATEADMVHRWFPTAELHAMIADGTFRDSHSLAALALLQLHR